MSFIIPAILELLDNVFNPEVHISQEVKQLEVGFVTLVWMCTEQENRNWEEIYLTINGSCVWVEGQEMISFF